MGEIIPILPQHVISHLKMGGFTLGKSLGFTQQGVPSNRQRVSSSRTAGWETKSVDRNGTLALTVNGTVHTPAEAVRLSFVTKGMAHYKKMREDETPRLIDHLTSQGFNVTPGEGSDLIVTREQ